MIHRPHGILLVTGPTGSGKSTSLYAWLHTINSIDKRILTLEDPIEYEMAGINQIQVRPGDRPDLRRGLCATFLRQDPDVIMVGEIRDQETAEIAIRAALTGHLVFSTLHTNDAAGRRHAAARHGRRAVPRGLLGRGAGRPAARAPALPGLPPAEARPDAAFLAGVGFPLERRAEGPLYEAVGCEECRHTGFRGRTGIYEIIVVTEHLRPLIVAHALVERDQAEALRRGMRTLREDGWNKVLAGITTIEEVLRVTEEDEALAEG